MGKLNDIKGYWNMSGGWDFNDNDMWEGKIILEEDGGFEGIVQDPNSPYTGDRMVFGIYHPTKVIELLKVAPMEVSAPFIFRGKRDAKGYDGEFSAIGLFGEMPVGVSHIITQDVEHLVEIGDSREKDRNIEAEKEELLKRLEAFKEVDSFKELYENTLAMRTQMSEIILRNHMGVGFSEEEQETIMSEVQPINDRVEKDTVEAAKKLVKTKPKNDDDLPF